MASTTSDKFVKRLGGIEGAKGKINEVVYHPAQVDDAKILGKVVYFGGDVQDYPENMAAHRDNKHYLSWNLEITSNLLSRKFENYDVYCVRPVRMQLKTFSCFDNFVTGDDIGSPCYELSLDCLNHMKLFLENCQNVTRPNFDSTSQVIIFVGFSKGCVVLNQLLYSLMELRNCKEEFELVKFTDKINTIYWLDGGHSGGSNTWIIDKKVIKNFATTSIEARIHVTPYQMERTTRPWVGKEEKIFRENLRKCGANIVRQMHFESEPASLENHFKVLEVFSP